MSPENSNSPVKSVRWVDRCAVVYATGDIDLERSPQFQQALLKLLDERPAHIVVNLKEVPYMDSSGVASLVKLLSRIRKSGSSLRLVELNERVRSLFEITRLDSVFDIRASEEEAIG